MHSPSGAPRPDFFTQGCRDLVRTFTYEDIVGCTIYASPMLFMIGPASIVAGEPLIAIVIQSLLGFVLGCAVHRMGHQLLTALPKEPCSIYVPSSRCVLVRLTVTQFLWVMELLVGAAVFAAVVGKRFLHTSDDVGLLCGLSFIIAAFLLYVAPLCLGWLWIQRYYPAMALVGPSDEVIKTSLPGIRSIFTLPRSIDR